MSASLLKAARRTRRLHRNSVVNTPQRTTPIIVTSVVVATSVATVTFDQPIALNDTPAYTTDIVGAVATSAEQTGTNTIAITFDATIATATEVRIPYEEPAVRNGSGGFVSTSTFPV